MPTKFVDYLMSLSQAEARKTQRDMDKLKNKMKK